MLLKKKKHLLNTGIMLKSKMRNQRTKIKFSLACKNWHYNSNTVE